MQVVHDGRNANDLLEDDQKEQAPDERVDYRLQSLIFPENFVLDTLPRASITDQHRPFRALENWLYLIVLSHSLDKQDLVFPGEATI